MIFPKHLLSFILLTLLFFPSICSDVPTQMLDGGRFQSSTSKMKTFHMEMNNEEKNLILLINPVDTDPQYENPVSVQLKSESSTTSCTFQSYDDLCVVEKVNTKKLSIVVKCENLPCEVEWSLYQAKMGDFSEATKTSQLYQFKQTNKHVNILFSCNKAEINNFADLMDIHSTNKFYKYVDQSFVYYFFHSVKDGYLYIHEDPKVKPCLSMKFSKFFPTLKSHLLIDYAQKQKPLTYNIEDIPKTTFSIITSVKLVSEIQSEPITETMMKIIIIGQKDGQRGIQRKSQFNVKKAKNSIFFTDVIPKIKEDDWDKLKVQITSTEDIMLEIGLRLEQIVQVQSVSYSYFSLKQGEKILYNLPGQNNADPQDQVFIYPSNKQDIKTNVTSCSVNKGCKFEVEAMSDVMGHIYLGDNDEGKTQILVLDFGESKKFTKKIYEGQQIYIRKYFEQRKAFQLAINTGNIMVYASSTKKCPLPSQTCYEKVGNIHNPFIYEFMDGQQDIIFMIKALDTSEFTITIIQQGDEFVQLKDGEAFAYTFDDNENQIQFYFKNPNKQAVAFNLISPLNSLNFYVTNSKTDKKNIYNTINSFQGYFKFDKKDIQSEDFTILVERKDEQIRNFIHFTIVASTKQSNMRLQSGITHYDVINAQQQVDYVFEFNVKEEYMINFAVSNVKSERLNVELLVSGSENWNEKKGKSFTIEKESYVLKLNEIAETMCIEEGQSVENCQIFISVRNLMDYQIEINLVLMTKHSVIEMRDGLWQTFYHNAIAETSHFYFFPRYEENDINIIYKSSQASLRLAYKVFNTLSGKINPVEWPFPRETATDQHQARFSQFKPIKHISINNRRLKECWPSCVILMSLISFSHQEVEGTFSIMATNNILEIPALEKIDIVVEEEQEKVYLIDLKYAFERDDSIIFYVSQTLGSARIYANVYSDDGQRIPEIEKADFTIEVGQTEISIEDLKEVINKEDINSEGSKYLYVIVEGETEAKLSLQYEIKNQNILAKMLEYDTFQNVYLEKEDKKYYYLRADKEYRIKLLRNQGFPYMKMKICQNQLLEKCLSTFQTQQYKGKQITTKTQIFKERPCQGCIALIRIEAQSAAQLQIHIESKFAQIQLTEGKITTDFTSPEDETNRYTIYGVKGEELVVNVHVIEGEVEVELTDLGHYDETKKGDKSISFVVPANYYEEDEKKLIQAKQEFKDFIKEEGAMKIDDIKDKEKKKKLQKLYEFSHEGNGQNTLSIASFGMYNKFTVLHMTIVSTNLKLGSEYTISYSSGIRTLYLEDGLIFSYNLDPFVSNFFYYSIIENSNAYLTFSLENAKELQNIQIKMYYCVNQFDSFELVDDCWKQFTLAKPSVDRKATSPTIMYSLPSQQKQFKFMFKYTGTQQLPISLGINNQQIILLPFARDYPFILKKGESSTLLAEMKSNGHFLMSVRKCGESEPTFSYTYDYEQLSNNEYLFETTLTNDPKYQFQIKKEDKDVLYMHLSSPDQTSYLSLRVDQSQTKIPTDVLKAGNKGQIGYSIKDSKTVQLTITPPSCSGNPCKNQVQYVIMSAENLESLYIQLVCPSSFFPSYENTKGSKVEERKLKPTENSDGTVSFELITNSIEFVGIKAIHGGEEVYYKPIEVATLLGQFSRTSQFHILVLVSVVVVFLIGLIVFVQSNARKGYKKISEEE